MWPDKRRPKGKLKRDAKSEDLLQELDQLQTSEKLPDVEPPALIDQAVRNMARRAVHNQDHNPAPHKDAQSQHSPKAGNLRWIAGLATASIAVIIFGLTLVQTPELTAPNFEMKKDKSRLKVEQTREVLQSAKTMRTEAADKPASEASRSATLQALKQAATPIAEAEELSTAMPPAMAIRGEQAFTDSADHRQQANKASAQAWLDLIQQLQDQGLSTEAAEQLRAFLQDYPNYPLPDWALELQQREQ